VANGALARTAAEAPAATARADRAEAQLPARRAFAAAPALVVVAADGTGRWRIAGGRIEHAVREGGPWTLAALPDPAPDSTPDSSGLTAGAAPGGAVCWLVGRAGTVLLTTDGLRFSRVPAPAASDLIGVRATDARTATVTAGDGRRFRTMDQGTSWSLDAVPVR